jgi:hypothetical protein
LRRTHAKARHLGVTAVLAGAVAALALLAVTTPSAPGEVLSPAVKLGPLVVANGTVTVSGSLGLPTSSVHVSINGQPLAIDAAGNFSGVVNLGGLSQLTFRLGHSNGEITSIVIPLNSKILGPGGVIPAEILAALEKAAVSILKPLEGFRILDGLPLRIEGSVGDRGSLASLTVNGQDVLGLLGQDRIFTIQLPGTTKEVSVTATDNQGVSQTSMVPVVHTTSMFTTPAGRSVSAAGAQGIRIAKIRYITRNVRWTKRLRMVITVRDRRGLLIRNATVSVRSRYARRIARIPRAKKTNRVGQAAFLLRAQDRAFGRRLVMITVARTPRAKARKRSSVRIPRLKRAPRRR